MAILEVGVFQNLPVTHGKLKHLTILNALEKLNHKTTLADTDKNT